MSTTAEDRILDDQILTDAEVRKILRQSRTGLFRLRKSGVLVGRQIGQRVFYLESDIKDFLSALPIADLKCKKPVKSII